MSQTTTIGYSVLAMLRQEGPISAYELASCMQRSFLQAIWPRAESRIYEEPKRLVREGLATSTSEPTGARPRTVYRLTAKGRKALRRWISQPSARFRYYSESLVKVGFGHQGTREDLRNNIEAVRADALEDARIYLSIAEQMATEGNTRSDRAHLAALVDEFIFEVIEARLRWAQFADDFSRDWDDVTPSEAIADQTQEWWELTAKRLRDLVSEHEEPSG